MDNLSYERWHVMEELKSAATLAKSGTAPLQKSRLSDAPQATPQLTHQDIGLGLEKAVRDGKLEPRILGAFATSPQKALASIPYDIAKSYGLPILNPERPPSREDVICRIEKAVRDGKLDPHLLGAFSTQPFNTLERIPKDVAETYGIPRLEPRRATSPMPTFRSSLCEWLHFSNEARR